MIAVNVLIFILITFSSCHADDACDRKWPRCKNIENIVCERGGTCDAREDSGCSPIKVDNSFRNWIVLTHNNYRDSLANGSEKRNGASSASNMMAINYDLDLEYTASCVANTCTPKPDKCARTKKFWQNGQSIELIDTNEEDLYNVLDKWYNRITNMKPEWFDRFKGKTGLPLTFTQMIWAETTHVGCSKAFSKINGKYILVCNYGPPGNIYEHSIIKRGVPASDCPADVLRNVQYTSLCGKVNLFDVKLTQRSAGRVIVPTVYCFVVDIIYYYHVFE